MDRPNDRINLKTMSKNANKEEWHDVKGYEGRYYVSNKGRILSTGRYVKCRGTVRRWNPSRFLKPGINSSGYCLVVLSDSGKRRSLGVSRLMARAFLPDFSEEMEVDHINGIKTDNRLDNIRMVTSAENSRAFAKKKHGCSSLFRGVSWNTKSKNWTAYIMFNGEHTHIGVFEIETDAAKAYNYKARELGFDAAAMNIIND